MQLRKLLVDDEMPSICEPMYEFEGRAVIGTDLGIKEDCWKYITKLTINNLDELELALLNAFIDAALYKDKVKSEFVDSDFKYIALICPIGYSLSDQLIQQAIANGVIYDFGRTLFSNVFYHHKILSPVFLKVLDPEYLGVWCIKRWPIEYGFAIICNAVRLEGIKC